MKQYPRLLSAAILAISITACDSNVTVVDAGDDVDTGIDSDTGIDGDTGVDNENDDTSTNDADAPTVSATEVAGASDAAATSLLNYTMPDINGGNRRENAVVLIPVGDAPEGGWPVIGWGHGTVGVADICAPSASDNLSGYDTYLNAWLASGFAIVAPDYEGLGTEGGHPYLHLDSEGRSINYAVAAAAEAFPELSDRYALLGHSQGGHAVLGAASLSAENPEITLVGTVALAPASQVLGQGAILEALSTNTEASNEERVSSAVGRLSFSALAAHGIETVFPDFDLDAIYGIDGQALQQSTETACLSQISNELATAVPPVLLTQNNLDSFIAPDFFQSPELLTYNESVEPGNRALNAPLLVAQGLSDLTVFPNSSIALIEQLSAVSDTDIDPVLETYEGAGHTDVLQASFNDAIAFLAARFSAE